MKVTNLFQEKLTRNLEDLLILQQCKEFGRNINRLRALQNNWSSQGRPTLLKDEIELELKRQYSKDRFLSCQEVRYNLELEMSVLINGNLDGEGYLDLFRYRLRRLCPGLNNGDQVFQDDNAPAHRARVTNSWFENMELLAYNGLQKVRI